MKRRATLLLTAMVLALMVGSRVALAANIECSIFVQPCRGTPDADVISGNNTVEFDDTIYALGGDDQVAPAGGNDTVYGGSGIDNVFGFLGNDTIYGGPGGDRNAANTANQAGLMGGEGSDKVYGQDGADRIDLALLDRPGDRDFASGGPGNDSISAFDGNKDTITCGKGTRDHVFFDRQIDVVNRNCENKHPNVAP
jgi:Ca2+-binding RTX toxin-like protein